MYSLNFAQFTCLTREGNLIPIYREIPADLDTPVSAFLKIRSGKNDFLLESVEGGEKWGRYSFLGTRPAAVFKSQGGRVTILRGKQACELLVQEDPLKNLEDFMSAFKPVMVPHMPRFFGGVVGFLAYDVVRSFEKLPATAKDELGLPDCYFMLTDTVVIFDNLAQTIKVVAPVFVDPGVPKKRLYDEAKKKIDSLVSKLQGSISTPFRSSFSNKKGTKTTLKPHLTEKEFCALTEKAQEYIRAGDIFQVQVSTRFEGKTRMDPFLLYRAIRRLNPSPYLYYLHCADMALVGASPEIMVRLEDCHVEVRPIAGTRRRGYSPEEDMDLEKELKNDPKERAEHIMLVDLGRNDLGRICKVGTVNVGELEVIERYSHVMHLVSQVSGELGDGKNVYDVIRATFPAGTLTGAPKIRAMEIIEELEKRRRGIYGGCVGYISFTGNTDMAITIRTALFHKGKIYVQAAAGIVYDSVPRLEYKECQNKARGMMKALELCF